MIFAIAGNGRLRILLRAASAVLAGGRFSCIIRLRHIFLPAVFRRILAVPGHHSGGNRSWKQGFQFLRGQEFPISD